jgi:WD40 repeat protein
VIRDRTARKDGYFEVMGWIWNTTTWQQIAFLTGHTSIVYDIAVFPNGRIIASVSRDETAQLWNLENGQPTSSPLQHTDSVQSLPFSADEIVLATGCSDNDAYTWDVDAIVGEAGLGVLLFDPRVSLRF